MLLRLLPLLLAVLLLSASCESDADRVVPPSPEPAQEVDLGKQQALNTALDTLEALVGTLERIEDPMGAWNRAPEVARLLGELEQTRGDYNLGTDEAEAARRYPAEVDRLKKLEARRDAEMNRIMEDRVIAQVLLEEMSKAEAERDSAAVGD